MSFALWLNLEDVYWAREGRASIDAVILFGALLLMGVWGEISWSSGVGVFNPAPAAGIDYLVLEKAYCLLIDADAFRTGRDNPEIRGRLCEFDPHFSSACVTTTNAGYTATSFRPILGVLNDEPLALLSLRPLRLRGLHGCLARIYKSVLETAPHLRKL